MFDEGQDVREEGGESPVLTALERKRHERHRGVVDLQRRQLLAGTLEIEGAQTDLLHVVHAGAESGGLAGGLHGR